MLCSQCGTQNEAAAKFCRECGSPLSATCPSCGAAVAPGSKFCSSCGTRLTDAPPALGRDAGAEPSTNAERRLVSVLFADLVGFTTYADQRDAEETRELLTRYFRAAEQIVDRYGGTIEKFIGDAVMAVWGTPTAHEDDAERAVRAALELVDAVAALGRENGVDLKARGGVMTGEAAVTIGATNQGMVAGDMVNTASRLQSAALPGTVLVGERTRQATSDAIAYEAAGEQQLKGKADAVATHRAVRVVAQRGGAGRSEQLEAPFVGRDTELRMLKDLFHATGAEQRPRLVSVIGQAGIGKSRLAWELQKYLDGLTEVASWHRGRCPAYGEGVSFWALGEMVRGRIGLLEGEGADVGLQKLDASLETFVSDAIERAWLRPALAELLGFEGGQRATTHDTLFAAWRTFFERIAEQGTAILLFEDLQWADPGLLAFIEHLLEWSRNRPIYIVTLARPELFDRRPDWAAGWRGATSLTLEPLTDDAMRALLDGLVPGLPEAARDRILERAEGVPLYAVETVRMLLAEGRIEPADGAYRPTGDLSELAVPESLHALVAARLDALEGPMRTLAQEASVLGKTFTPEALAAVSGRDQAELEPMLRDLVRRELFVIDADPRSPERGQYGFVQSVIREVAYGMLARRERRRLHLAAARYFESLGDEEISGALAGHYLDAYRARPEGPEGAAVATQARLALRAAAERATALRSADLALQYLEQALEVARDDADRIELELLAGETAIQASDPQRARHHVGMALNLARAAADRPAELRAIATQGLTDVLEYDIESALPPLVDAAERFADLEQTDAYAALIEMIARVHMRMMQVDATVAWADRGLPIAEKLGNTRLTLELLITRGVVLANAQRLVEAEATLRGARAIAAELRFADAEVRACVNIGFALAPYPKRAFTVSREGFDVAMRLGMRSYLPFLVGNLCGAAVPLGEWDTSFELLMAIRELSSDPTFLVQNDLDLALLETYRGEDPAPRLARVEANAPRNDPQTRAGVADTLAKIALVRGEYAAAVVHMNEAIASAPDVYNMLDGLVSARALLWTGDAAGARAVLDAWPQPTVGYGAAAEAELAAGVAALEGRVDEATEQFAAVRGAYEELGLVFERALSGLTMLAVLPPWRRDVAAAVADARAVLERLRAASWLARLDELLARSAAAAPAVPDASSAGSSMARPQPLGDAART
jgi:class 3 adenylate cyclase/tetratricopeptide (TPR) repeat protein